MKKVIILAVLAVFVLSLAAQALPNGQYVFWGRGATKTASYNNVLKKAIIRLQQMGYTDMEFVGRPFWILAPNCWSCKIKVRGIK